MSRSTRIYLRPVASSGVNAGAEEDLVEGVRDELIAFAEATARAIVARTQAQQPTRLIALPDAPAAPAPVLAAAPTSMPTPPIPTPPAQRSTVWAVVPIEALLPMGALMIVLVLVLAWLG